MHNEARLSKSIFEFDKAVKVFGAFKSWYVLKDEKL